MDDIDTSRPLIVFDRDDTLIQDQGRRNSHRNICWFPGAIKIVALLSAKGYNLAIATNQPGVQEGIHTLEHLWLFNSTLNFQFKKYTNKPIVCIASCIHSKLSRCSCRKPQTGLLEEIEGLYGSKPQVFIGDKDSDIQTAQNFGIDGLIVNKDNIYSTVIKWLEHHDRN